MGRETVPLPRSCRCYFRLACYIFATPISSQSLAQAHEKKKNMKSRQYLFKSRLTEAVFFYPYLLFAWKNKFEIIT